MKRKGADYHHGDLRRALVEATLRLVAEHGPEGFTLRAAARLAGVSDGAPYHHFADKGALLAAAAAASYPVLCAEMKRAADAELDQRSKGRAMATAYVAFAARDPSRFRLMFGPALESRTRHPELIDAARGAFELLRKGFRDAQFSAGRAIPVGAWALVHGLSLLAIDGHLGRDGKSPRRLERILRDVLVALAVPTIAVVQPRDRQSEPPDAGPRSGRRVKAARDRGGAVAVRR